MENKQILDIINSVIIGQTKTLVGVLLKRIEVLEQEEALTPSLYKSLVKEHLYEFARSLQNLLKLHIELGKVEFKHRPKG